jgi:hypothetical protein
MRLNYHTIQARFLLGFRRRRMQRFYALFAPASSRVLDIGGTPQTWTMERAGSARLAGEVMQFPVTLVNIRSNGIPGDDRFTSVEGDATALPFADNEFDIAFSNSVIEHVGEWQKQQAFAREARRVARSLWVQTPARGFPIEPHLLAPYFQYLPKRVQHCLVRGTPRGLLSPAEAHEIVDEVRLLTRREMRELFPDCRILTERVLGMAKSYIAVRGVGAIAE